MTGSQLAKWNMPDGTPVTFRDCRPGVKTAEPDDNGTLAAFDIIVKALAETHNHEGRHAAVGMLFGIPLAEARAAFPTEDGVLGYVKLAHDDEQLDRLRLAEHAVMILAGPVDEKAGPPAWPPRSNDGMASDYSDEKALAHIVRRLNLSERQYAGLVDLARTLTRNPGIKRVAERIGTLLECGVTLNARQLKDIHDGMWREIAEETRPRTQDEIEDDELREHFRSWMTTRLEEGVRYHDEQAERKAARDLRRRAMELAAEVERTTTKHHRGSRRTSVFPAAITTH